MKKQSVFWLVIFVFFQFYVFPLTESYASPEKIIWGYYNKDGNQDKTAEQSVLNYHQNLTALGMSSFQLDWQGNIKDDLPKKTLQFGKNNGLQSYAVIHNFVYPKGFDTELVSSLLNESNKRKRLINNILHLLQTHHFDGVNIDLEQIPARDKTVFLLFLQELKTELTPYGYHLVVSVPGKTPEDNPLDWAFAYDYRSIGEVADYVQLMTYDQHWSGSRPGPVASIDWVSSVLANALNQIDPAKILLGIATYGYDWSPSGGKMITQRNAQNLLQNTYSIPIWSEADKEYFFSYQDQDGLLHQVWFEDEVSAGYKFDLVHEHKLAGIAFWRLGYESNAFWQVVKEKLTTQGGEIPLN